MTGNIHPLSQIGAPAGGIVSANKIITFPNAFFPNSEVGQLLWQVLLLSVNVPDASGLETVLFFGGIAAGWLQPSAIWI